jgi:hypothetical protein
LAGYTIANNVTLSGGGSLTNSASNVIAVNNLALGASGAVNTNGKTLTVNNLSGSGTITGDVVVGGTLNPGSSPGLISVTSMTLGSFTTFEIWGNQAATSDPLTHVNGFYDTINLTGTSGTTLTLGSGTISVLLNGSPAYAPVNGDVFHLFTIAAGGGINSSGFDLTAFSNNLPALGGGLSWKTDSFTSTGSISVVPEPGTLGLLGRRRRDRK